MNAGPGPRCPGCGYPIFGLRDMRCPECGRVLDIRDFNPDTGDSEVRMKRLRRDGRIGALGATLLLLIPLGLAVLVAGAFLHAGFFPPTLIVLAIIGFAVWLGRVVIWAGREELTGRRKKR